MKVTVKLYNLLRRYAPGPSNAFILELPPGACVKDLMVHLSIPPQVQRLIFVNESQAQEDTALSQEDTIVIFSPAEGG